MAVGGRRCWILLKALGVLRLALNLLDYSLAWQIFIQEKVSPPKSSITEVDLVKED